MQFIHRVREIWAWLPAFRAVAETEHLPTAAGELGLAPSSLSRAVKQLEEALGVELFDHASKSLTLDPAGEILLTAVRKAMRLLDEAIREISGTAFVGCATVVTSETVPVRVLPAACLQLHADHPELTISTRVAPDDEIDKLLLRGAVDVAVVTSPRRAPELASTELARWQRGVYRAASAPASASPRFVVVGSRASTPDDGWPADAPREIAMWAHDEQLALALSARGTLAVVATDHAAAAHGGLARQPFEVADQVAYLVHRRSVGGHPRTDALAAALRVAVAQL